MKILLDHNLDRRLKQYLTDHNVSTVQELGWADVLNGELLTLLDGEGFEVLITADANIKAQQNLANRKIAILILRALNNRLATHLEMLPEIHVSLSTIEPGKLSKYFTPISLERPRARLLSI